ncbi:MAG: hypothetical protein R6V50_04320 [Thermoplasmatota archaeon]
MKKMLLITGLCLLLFISSIQAFTYAYPDNQRPSISNVDQMILEYSSTITIYNPYVHVDFETINHYKANLHTHTTESDGSRDPDVVIYHYTNIGNYDILAITDHNKNMWPWSDWISETPINSSKSSAYYPDLEILAISGNELSWRHHVLGLLNDYPFGGFFYHLAFWYIQRQNGVSIFAHPGRYDYSDRWYQHFFNWYGSVIGIEVYNQGDRYPTDRFLWDRINKERDPDDLVWGFSNDDMHCIPSHAFRNYQHFLMNELTETEFRNAITDGLFYFSYEPNGADNTNENYGKAMTPKLVNVTVTENTIQLTAEGYNSIEWYDQDSQIIGSDSLINVSTINSNFVRAVMINDYGRTYTQPFGIQITRN